LDCHVSSSERSRRFGMDRCSYFWTTPVRWEIVEVRTDRIGEHRRFESHRFGEISRYGALPLAIPVLISVLGSWAAYQGRAVGVVSAALALAGFTYIAGFSIGLSYLPAVGGLALAGLVAVGGRTPPRSESRGAA